MSIETDNKQQQEIAKRIAGQTKEQRLAKLKADGPIKEEPIELNETKRTVGELKAAYTANLSGIQTQIGAYSGDVKSKLEAGVKAELDAYKLEAAKLEKLIPTDVAAALQTLQEWNGILSDKGLYKNAEKTFATAGFKVPKEEKRPESFKLKKREEFETALLVVAKYLKLDVTGITVDGKVTDIKEREAITKIQETLDQAGSLKSVDNLDNKNRKAKVPVADGVNDNIDSWLGGTTVQAFLTQAGKKSLADAQVIRNNIADRLEKLNEKLQAEIAKAIPPTVQRTEEVVKAEKAVIEKGVEPDTATANKKLEQAINTGNAFRDELIVQLRTDISDRTQRNVAMLSLYQMKGIDFKAVINGTVPDKQKHKVEHKLVELLAGIEGRHTDYDQNQTGGKGQKSYRANVKAAQKQIELDLKNYTGEEEKTQYLLNRAAKSLEALLTKKSNDSVYKSGKEIYDFGKEPDLSTDHKAASILADKLKYDVLFELFGLGKDESKVVRARQ
jgi:hypothetical protein